MNRAEIILAEKCLRSNEIRRMKLRQRYSENEKGGIGKEQTAYTLPPISINDNKPEVQLLAYELSMRANTPKTQFRKVQAAIRRRIVNGEEDDSTRLGSSFGKLSSSEGSNEVVAPKKIVVLDDKLPSPQVESIIMSTKSVKPSTKDIVLDEREIKISTELAEKGLTPRTKFRKLQANIKKRLEMEISPVHTISLESMSKF